MMAFGAAIMAVGTLLMLLPLGLPGLFLSRFIAGVGGSALMATMLFAVAAKGTVRWRGFAIGAVAMATTLRMPGRFRDICQNWGLAAAILAAVVLLLACAVLLHRYMPRLFPKPVPDREERSLREVISAPGFKKTFWGLAAVFVITATLSNMSNVFYPQWVNSDDLGVDWPIAFEIIWVSTSVSALLWGIASMYIQVRRLFVIASLLLVVTAFVPAVSVGNLLLIGIANGALLSLPWVLAVDLLGIRRLATLALGLAFVGGLVGTFGVWLAAWSYDIASDTGIRIVAAGFGVALIAVVYAFSGTKAAQEEQIETLS